MGIQTQDITVRRLLERPIIVPDMDARMGDNIAGPSLIRVPDWIERPLGRYYLYFASHWGTYIRLAVADQLTGPWQMHEAGAFDLAQSRFIDHVASPDVIVDNKRREIRMYYHGVIDLFPNQRTRVAISRDGMSFEERPDIILDYYARIFCWDGWWYALTMPGTIWRSRDGLSDFERGPALFEPNMRHSAVRVAGQQLQVFYSNIGDCPESILMTTIDLTSDWRSWAISPSRTLLIPERDYEGGLLPRRPSVRGPSHAPSCALRDPAIYEEEDRTFMLYAIAGESGLALTEITGSSQQRSER